MQYCIGDVESVGCFESCLVLSSIPDGKLGGDVECSNFKLYLVLFKGYDLLKWGR